MEKQKAIEDLEYLEIYHLFYSKKYDQVVKKATKYLDNKPYNRNIRYFRARSYRILKQYNEAIEDLKYGITNFKCNYKIYLELYFIYYNLGMYEEAHSLVDIIKNKKIYCTPQEFKNFEISEIVLNNILGIKSHQPKYKYIQDQLKKYDENETLKHIRLYSEQGVGGVCFTKDIDIDYLYNLVKENLDKYEKYDINSGLDLYLFSVANVGINNNKSIVYNSLKVLTIPNTNKIITMRPGFDDLGISEPLDVDYDKLFKEKIEKPKQKTLSQIDKFNKKYSR